MLKQMPADDSHCLDAIYSTLLQLPESNTKNCVVLFLKELENDLEERLNHVANTQS